MVGAGPKDFAAPSKLPWILLQDLSLSSGACRRPSNIEAGVQQFPQEQLRGYQTGDAVGFQQFWAMYLRGHSQPGTRVIHYFSTVLGLLCTLQLVYSQRPLFAVGIAVSYAFAIGAHRFIERNAPLIRVSVWWGIVADLRMCWLAIRGRLAAELDQVCAETEAESVAASSPPSPALLRKLDAAAAILGTLGLAWSMLDLADLFENAAGPGFNFVQLGIPVVAFWAAAGAGFGAYAVSSRRNSGSIRTARAASSLRRACLALLVVGSTAFMAAEAAEHGVFVHPDSTMAAITGLTVAVVMLSLAIASRGKRTIDDAVSTFGAGLWKLIGLFGSATTVALGLVILGWQGAPLLDGGGWRSLPLADLLQAGPGHPAALAWLLQAPSSLSFFLASVIFLALGLFAANREYACRAEHLFAHYRAKALGENERR